MATKLLSKKELTGLVIIILLFVLSAFFSNLYKPQIEILIGGYGAWGLLFYFLFSVFETIVAPISTLPVLPIAVAAWGSFIAVVLSVLAWTVGGVVAFLISRKHGRPLIEKFFDLKKAEALAKSISSENMFWTLLFARMVIPMDLLSYAVGLFVPIRVLPFAIATAVGFTPFAVVFAYASEFSLVYTVIASVSALILMFLGYKYFTYNKNTLE